MAKQTKLHGRINLSRIPKNLITKSAKGDSQVWVDIVKKRETDQYGNTHSLQIWTKDTGTIYLGDFREQEFGRDDDEPAQEKPVIITNEKPGENFFRDNSLEPQPEDLPF